MINIKLSDLLEARPSRNQLVDGELEDGRYVKFKVGLPRIGINPKFIKYRPNVNTSQSKGIYNNVDFELFDIDNMPGPQKITIY